MTWVFGAVLKASSCRRDGSKERKVVGRALSSGEVAVGRDEAIEGAAKTIRDGVL